MAREIELKLSLDPQHAEALMRLPMLATEAGLCGRTPLHNQYFDTPDRLLAAHRVALRIREQDGRFIQTLKTRGSSQGGLHQRNEWEWDLQSATLDYTLLAEAEWPRVLDTAVVQHRIRPAFRTDFDRTTWMLRRRSPAGEPILIELALDHGQVTAVPAHGEARHTALSEVELELKLGTAQDLYDAALELAAAVPLMVSDVSKAERGYRLMSEVAPDVQPAVLPEVPSGHSSNVKMLQSEVVAPAAFVALAEAVLTDASRGLDSWRSDANWHAAETAGRAFADLKALLQCFSQTLPVPEQARLNALLETLCRRLDAVLGWRRLNRYLDPAGQDAWARHQAPPAGRRLDALMQNPLPGVILLEYGRLLQTL